MRPGDRILTSLGDDGSGGNHDNGPVELALEVGDDLLADLVEGGDGSVGNLHEEALASGTVLLLVFL